MLLDRAERDEEQRRIVDLGPGGAPQVAQRSPASGDSSQALLGIDGMPSRVG